MCRRIKCVTVPTGSQIIVLSFTVFYIGRHLKLACYILLQTLRVGRLSERYLYKRYVVRIALLGRTHGIDTDRQDRQH